MKVVSLSKMRISHWLFFCLVLLVACKSTTSIKSNAVADIVTDKLGELYDSYPNETGEYVLCVQSNSQGTNNTLRFVVVDVKQEKIVLEKVFRPGYVKWYDDSQIELSDQPGIVRESDDLSKFIKVIQVKKSNE